MRAFGIVVSRPGGDYDPGVGQVAEHGLVEQLVPHSAVEALHEAVLHRLARRDVVPLDPALLLPLQDRVRGELGPVARREEALFEVMATRVAPK